MLDADLSHYKKSIYHNYSGYNLKYQTFYLLFSLAKDDVCAYISAQYELSRADEEVTEFGSEATISKFICILEALLQNKFNSLNRTFPLPMIQSCFKDIPLVQIPLFPPRAWSIFTMNVEYGYCSDFLGSEFSLPTAKFTPD